MTPKEFWEDNGEMFSIYEKAYIDDLHQKAHIQGLYFNEALNVVFGNVFAKKGQKPHTYPETPIFSPYDEKYQKQKAYEKMSSKEKDKVYKKKMSFWNHFKKNKKGSE